MSDPAHEHHSDPLPLLGTVTEAARSRGIDQELLRTVLVHLPVAVSVLDADLRFILVNQRAAEINGLPADAHVDRFVFDLLPGIPRSIGTLVRRVIETGEPETNVDIVGSTPARPDSPRWRGSYYPVYAAAGERAVAVAIIFDEVDTLDTPQGVGELAADRATNLAVLDTLIDNAPIGVAVLDTDLRYLRVNPTLAEWNGQPAAAHIGRRLRDVLPASARTLEPLLTQVAASGRMARDVAHSAAGRDWLSSYYAVPGPSGETAALAVLVTDITVRRRGERRARRLQRFTAALAQALTVSDVVEAVTDTGARAADADVAGVAVLDRDGSGLVFLASTATAGEPAARWAGVHRDADHPVARALRTGEPAFLPTVPAMTTRYPHLADTQAQTPDRAWAIVPLRGPAVARGVLTFAFHTEQSFDDEHRDLLTSVAGLAGQALARAQLYEREHDTAVRLQRSLLPSRLPQIHGLALAAAYITAEAAEVGGDFYDIFPTHAPHMPGWVFVIGDVAGRGIAAAAVTGIARHTLRVTAAQAPPAEALHQLHRQLVAAQDVDRFVTVACALLQPHDAGASVQLASGGHPPVLIRRVDGRVDVVEVRGVLLGAFPTVTLDQSTIDLHPGDTMVLYTDGVIEARGADGLFGEQRLVAALATAPNGTPATMVERIRAAVTAHQTGPQTDDLAILAVQLTPPG
ncbi:SpoIIE family protein phosphatase [Micromonospora sp. NPDC051141]|uniref:SpoIIE family protein phosphatase n=1 Tax=Micromonospora sp. NPDC051141 TaxID=3364284 RepID=UPI0037B17733